MLDRLRRRIVTLNVAFVGIILIVVCIFSYKYSEKAVLTTYKESFSSACKLFENQLSLLREMNHRNIYEFEQANGLMLYLFDNDVYLNVPYTNDLEYRNELLNAVQGEIDYVKGDRLTSQSQWGKVRVEGDFSGKFQDSQYFGRYVALPNRYGTWLEFVALQSMDPYNKELEQTRLYYIFLIGLGFIVVAILNYILAKKAIQPAIKAQETQNEFVAAAGHELKSPLSVILASSEMLITDKAHYEEYSGNITSEAQRMSKLVDELLLLARLNFSHAELQRCAVDTEGLLLSVYERFLPVAKESGHTLLLSLPKDDLDCTFIDDERIVQVLSILLSNAFCYAQGDMRVEISAYKQHKAVCVSVVDHGEGIREKSRVFDKFYRHEKGRSQKKHFGLGLSIANEIMQRHDSKIVLTDTIGGGATFTIVLPIAPKD